MQTPESLHRIMEKECQEKPLFHHYWSELKEEEKENFLRSITNAMNEEIHYKPQFDLPYFEKNSHDVAKELETLLSSFCKQSISVQVLNVQRLSFETHMNTLKNKAVAFTVLNIFQQDNPTFGRICLEMDLLWVDFIYEHLLGGNTTSLDVKNNVLSEIKRTILEEWINSYIEPILNETIFLNSALSIQTNTIETNSSYVKIAKQNDSVISMSFSASVGETTGTFHIILPETTLHMIHLHSEEGK